MLSLLPSLVLVLACCLFWRRCSSVRLSFIVASLLLSTGVLISTEVFSLLKMLVTGAIFVFWTASAAMCIYAFKHVGRRVPGKRSYGQYTRSDLIEWGLVVLCVVPFFAVAWTWAPNNFDTMTYHLPRVFHWVQNGSVEHYPTANFRQLYQPSLLEYWLLHLRLLGASEEAFTLFPAFTLVLAGFAASLVAEEISRDRRAARIAFVFVVTLPTAILQGTVPKNDVFVGFWVVVSMYFLFKWHQGARKLDLLFFFTAIALAFATKGTAWVYSPVILGAFSLGVWNKRAELGWKGVGRICAIGAFIAASLLLPHHIRNFKTFGSPLGPKPEHGEAAYGNERVTPGVIVSNLVRNVALELQTPFAPLNTFLHNTVAEVHQWIGLDVSAKETTWPGVVFDLRREWELFEDLMPNPVAAVLVGCSVVFLLLRRRPWQSFPELTMLGFLVLGALLFSALLKWQPWHCRLHIPWLFVGSIAVAYWVQLCWRPFFQLSLVLVCGAFAGWLAWNAEPRPLRVGVSSTTSREERFVRANPPYIRDLRIVMAKIKALAPEEIALVAGSNEWEYPIWREMEVQGVTVPMHRYDSSLFAAANLAQAPKAAVVLVVNRTFPLVAEVDSFAKVLAKGDFGVYIRRDSGLSAPIEHSGAPEVLVQFDYATWYSEEEFDDSRWRWCAKEGTVDVTVKSTVERIDIEYLVSSSVPGQVVQLLDEDGAVLASDQTKAGIRTRVKLTYDVRGRSSIKLKWRAEKAFSVAAEDKDRRVLSFALYNLGITPSMPCN